MESLAQTRRCRRRRHHSVGDTNPRSATLGLWFCSLSERIEKRGCAAAKVLLSAPKHGHGARGTRRGDDDVCGAMRKAGLARHARDERDTDAGRDERLDGLELRGAEDHLRMALLLIAKAQRLIAETVPFLEEDETLGLDVLQPHASPPGEWMIRRHGQEQVLGEEIFALESVVGDRPAEHRKIDLARSGHDQELRGRRLVDDYVQPGITLPAKRQHARQQIRRDGRQHTEGNYAAHLAARIGDIVLRRLDIPDDTGGADEQGAARGCRHGLAFQPGEKPVAEFGFQLLNLLAERGLRHVAVRGGAAEIAHPGDGERVAELVEFHRQCLW